MSSFVLVYCRLEAERKELQEKEDAYCHYLLKVADDVVKYKTHVKVMNPSCCHSIVLIIYLGHMAFSVCI